MLLSVDEVRRIALLARLRLSVEEEEVFVPQLAEIIGYFDQLTEYGSEPEIPEEVATLEADDVPGESMDRGEFLSNAPEALDTFVLVPQVKVTGDE